MRTRDTFSVSIASICRQLHSSSHAAAAPPARPPSLQNGVLPLYAWLYSSTPTAAAVGRRLPQGTVCAALHARHCSAMDTPAHSVSGTGEPALLRAPCTAQLVGVAQRAAKFATLLENDALWRNRVLKALQYGIKIILWAYKRAGGSMLGEYLRALLERCFPLARLPQTASLLSAVRRTMILGDGIVYSVAAAKQAAAMWKGDASVASVVEAVLDATAGLAEDVSTLGRLGVLDAAALPAPLLRYVDIAWAVQCLIALYRAAVQLVGAAPGPPRVPVAMGFAKCVCDVVHSVPYAIEWGGFPDGLEVSVGFGSAVFAMARTWSASS
ncbi:hypothetical protein EON62_01340 [archaeon]|nr:MAG: hypothetical protein EON62_01340 [archaeon]